MGKENKNQMKRNGHEYITASLAGHPRVNRKIGGMQTIGFACDAFFAKRGMTAGAELSAIKQPKSKTK